MRNGFQRLLWLELVFDYGWQMGAGGAMGVGGGKTTIVVGTMVETRTDSGQG